MPTRHAVFFCKLFRTFWMDLFPRLEPSLSIACGNEPNLQKFRRLIVELFFETFKTFRLIYSSWSGLITTASAHYRSTASLRHYGPGIRSTFCQLFRSFGAQPIGTRSCVSFSGLAVRILRILRIGTRFAYYLIGVYYLPIVWYISVARRLSQEHAQMSGKLSRPRF